MGRNRQAEPVGQFLEVGAADRRDGSPDDGLALGQGQHRGGVGVDGAGVVVGQALAVGQGLVGDHDGAI
ncbi:MAG: hypothetical protein ACK4WC_09895, partial [Rubrimonas sp.]